MGALLGACRGKGEKVEQDDDAKEALVPAHARDPIPSYLASSGCPFAKHFPSQPKNFDKWGAALLEKFEQGWANSDCPMGPEHNDHQWTPLGTGNTCGLVQARLEIGHTKKHRKNLTSLDPKLRVGLFEDDVSSFPAVLRFSDFGPDGNAQQRLLRMACKIPYAGSWCGEVNLLTTETLESFALADGDAVEVFTRGKGQTPKGAVRLVTGLVKSVFDMWYTGQMNSGDPFGKTYHSQLPYKLGANAAMKFRFVPNDRLDDDHREVNDTVAATRKAMAKGLAPGPPAPAEGATPDGDGSSTPAPAQSSIAKAWTLEIQVHPDQVCTGHVPVMYRSCTGHPSPTTHRPHYPDLGLSSESIRQDVGPTLARRGATGRAQPARGQGDGGQPGSMQAPDGLHWTRGGGVRP